MAAREDCLMGSIVAFEGKPDTVLTQLRLLPTSPQLLILPSIESYIKPRDEDGEECFNVRAFIRKVHNASLARKETARNFLSSATADHKRLVFVNGGTPGAQALCVMEIMKHETNGDRSGAEAMFEDIIKDGLAGLEEQISTIELEQDPITRAMRAADALDRQTANLQPIDPFELGHSTRPRSSSLPLYGFLDELQDSTPFYVFGLAKADEDVAPEDAADPLSAPPTPSVMITGSRHLSIDTPQPRPSFSTVLYSGSSTEKKYESIAPECRPETVAASPRSVADSIRSPDKAVFGEASVLDIRQVTARQSIVRVKSLDRIYTASPILRDAGIPSESWLAEPDTPGVWQQRHSIISASDVQDRRLSLISLVDKPRTIVVKSRRSTVKLEPDAPRVWQHRHSIIPALDAQDRRLSLISLVDRPRTIVVKSRLSIVKLEPVPAEKKRGSMPKTPDNPNSSYVDRGTDARKGTPRDASFQPILPPTEDLVVFLKDESSDMILESAIDAFKNRRYPILSFSPTVSEVEVTEASAPGTPILGLFQKSQSMGMGANEPVMACPDGDGEDYDPFAYTQSVWRPDKPEQLVTVAIVRPPTPARTPPPPNPVKDTECKVHEFLVTHGQTAVSVQNSLRSILGEYFQPDTQGYHQFQFSFLPEFDELWKPIFRGGEPGTPQRNDGVGTNILAIGSQAGVRKEYSLAVTGKLEKVGRKSCEIVKTGRVDFRYLLANAMQAFTAQRLANQTSDNPFNNSFLLATLIVPHLETYLALHTDVRHLLLLYPPEHLATVLALQRLVGVDVMKVAQIVDSESQEDSPFTHIRGASINSKSESRLARSPFSPRCSSEIDISKANYLLTSTASEKDIATFVSTVWNIDIEEPPMAPAPEQSAEKPSRKKKPPPLTIRKDTRSSLPKVASESPVSPTTVVLPLAPPVPPEPASPTASLGAHSLAETLRTLRSARSKFGQSKSRGKNSQHAETESLSAYDFDDDSDEDIFERRLMPMFMQKHLLPKPNSRKALKFLGLA